MAPAILQQAVTASYHRMAWCHIASDFVKIEVRDLPQVCLVSGAPVSDQWLAKMAVSPSSSTSLAPGVRACNLPEVVAFMGLAG